MPGPPPPPPPGCPPPPMPAAPFAAALSKGGSDDRGALLKAIRNQPKLQRVDKSLINDRSAPLGASGNSSPTRCKSSGAPSSGSPNGLGGLFQGGMPKLKSVHRTVNNVSEVSHFGGSYGNIQEELRKRLNHDGRSASRGPAPPAPTRNIINEVSSLQSKNEYHMNSSHVHNSQAHRKTQSNGNVNTLDNNTPKMSFGKPNLAPKPPVLEKPTQNTLANGKLRKSHSVRLPSSPISRTPLQDSNMTSLNHQLLGADVDKFRTLGGSTGHLSQVKTRLINGRPNVPPPSIPIQANPVTPSGKVKPPNHAPPPPPSVASLAPPPPPHRTVPPVPTRAPPAVPTHIAPAPPPRNSSIRSAAPPPTNGPSFESRYIFRPACDFPPPARFQNMTKVYTTRQASKQPAPQPPQNQIQIANSNRLWESSTC